MPPPAAGSVSIALCSDSASSWKRRELRRSCSAFSSRSRVVAHCAAKPSISSTLCGVKTWGSSQPTTTDPMVRS